MKTAAFPVVTLKPGKENSLLRRHPWVFSGAIARTERPLVTGEIVEVLSSKGQYLGTGHWADGSISVRIFSFSGYSGTADFWRDKIASAFRVRCELGLVDNAATNIYRLIHAEGDGMPGMIVDIYGKTAVLQAHSVGMYAVKEHIVEAIKEVMGDRITTFFDKSAEKLQRNTGAVVENQYLSGSTEDNIGLEYGHKFKIDWEEGQKTGFFIDQRENRRLLGEYSKGKKVLNTFCYTGGFSIYALAAGAQLVHSLDSSQKALDLTEENVRLNGFDHSRHAVIKADAVEYLKHLNEVYDVVVLDPPAFAKNLSARHKAVQGYMRINEAAIRQMKPGGILFTFSCSQAVDKQLFRDSVVAATIQAGRTARILHQLHQPADHPVHIFHPEGEYLKGLVLEIE